MTMTPGVRKFALMLHVVCSIGWFGAVAAFLALAVAGLTTQDARVVRAAYLGMQLTGWLVIVPFAFTSLLTGFVSSVGTAWGLLRHYWVVAKLVMTIPATMLLLVHMPPINHIAQVAADTTLSATDFRALRIQLVAEAAAALVVLLVATALSVYKPRGMTRYGWRKNHEQRLRNADAISGSDA